MFRWNRIIFILTIVLLLAATEVVIFMQQVTTISLKRHSNFRVVCINIFSQYRIESYIGYPRHHWFNTGYLFVGYFYGYGGEISLFATRFCPLR